MTRFSLVRWLRYEFDNLMARGSFVLIAGLGVLSLLMILVAASIISFFRIAPANSAELPFAEAFWLSLMRSLDAGTMGQDAGWGFRLAMFGVTVGGIFIISTLIGLLTNVLQMNLERLRRGRSHVVERDHTIILGWSPAIITIVHELVTAHLHRPRSCIVILGDRGKVEMETEIREKVGSTGNTHIVCRQGNPMAMTDLDIVSLQTSRAIIILKPETENPDAAVIKIIMAIMNNPRRRPEPYHIVACIRDSNNMEIARLIGQDEVVLIQINDILARVTAQTCRRSGLSVVYNMLLNFEDDEIHFHEDPWLFGKKFGEALVAYENSSPIGLLSAEGKLLLHPPMDRRISRGDQIITISENDEPVNLFREAHVDVDESVIQRGARSRLTPEKTLILGWNWKVPHTINELDHYVSAGSELLIVANSPDGQETISLECSGLRNLRVTYRTGDITNRRLLASLGIEMFDHIIIHSYSDTLSHQEADSVTMITLLHLRDLGEKNHHRVSVVSEMLDLNNRELAEVARADDFILSIHLISLLLAQISQNKHLMAIFADFFDCEGAEIYIRDATDYVKLGEPVTFFTVVEAARRRGEIAIGYRLKGYASNPPKNYGVVMNPRKSRKVTFSEGDRVIVVAEAEIALEVSA